MADKTSVTYKNLLLDTRSFNKGLVADRRYRIPFIDSHTGIAQTNCSLWQSDKHRLPNEPTAANSSFVYKYPASRWQKCRREYLIGSDVRPNTSDLLSNSSVLEYERHIMNDRSPNHRQRITCLDRDASEYSFRYTNNYQAQSAPPRADSTGSQSLIDSDSRDQSSTNSQTHDSPRRTPTEHDDQIMCQDLDSNFTDSMTSQKNLKSSSSGRDTESKILRDQQTREAIRLHSRMSRKRNAGQSLIKCSNSKSILVKDTSQTQIQKVNLASRKHGMKESKASAINNIDHNAFVEGRQLIEGQNPSAIRCFGSKRPYVCSICDQRYKTRPGLSYHFIHTHNMVLPRNLPSMHLGNMRDDSRSVSNVPKGRCNKGSSCDDDPPTRVLRNTKINHESPQTNSFDVTQNGLVNGASIDRSSNEVSDCRQQSFGESYPPKEMGEAGHAQNDISDAETDISEPSSRIGETDIVENTRTPVAEQSNQLDSSSESTKKIAPNPFCDFCHGTSEKNRRTRLPEELISCSSCGSSGHPTCLRFSANICSSVKNYEWQCIDCKTCSICFKADNEDQLLFCDDCDRSYHTYCLSPPLKELPEGNWTCQLCLVEYYNNCK